MAFLQRIVNGGGKTTREMAVGRGRTDLVVEFEGDTFVLELKIKYSNYRHEKAYEQLIRYLDTVNQPHGYLVLFENKKSTEIPWEQRIKWTELEHEWRGIKKQITLVEM
jgi:RecB family endonuclease NucS